MGVLHLVEHFESAQQTFITKKKAFLFPVKSPLQLLNKATRDAFFTLNNYNLLGAKLENKSLLSTICSSDVKLNLKDVAVGFAFLCRSVFLCFQGNPVGQSGLGMAYLYGRGVPVVSF